MAMQSRKIPLNSQMTTKVMSLSLAQRFVQSTFRKVGLIGLSGHIGLFGPSGLSGLAWAFFSAYRGLISGLSGITHNANLTIRRS